MKIPPFNSDKIDLFVYAIFVYIGCNANDL